MVLFIVGTAAFWKPAYGQQFIVDEVKECYLEGQSQES